jgi:osmotically-inducible protein OsmY
VGVKNGNVTLEGTVHSLFEKFYAEDDTSRITGVRYIENRLKVIVPTQPSVSKTDADISSSLRRALRTDPVLDSSDNVTFTVKGGKVTLNGVVDSWVEATAAVKNAFTSGAHKVVTNLKRPNGDTRGITSTMNPINVYSEYWVSGIPWLTDSSSDSGTISGTSSN